MVRVLCMRAGGLALLVIAALTLAGGGSAAAGADQASAAHLFSSGPPQRFDGEIHCYAISIWLFRNAAVGRLSFASRTDGTFEGVFEARTAGLLRRIAGSRTVIMKSRMAFDNATRRFRPVRYEEIFIYGDGSRTRTVDYDYRQATFTFTRARSGKVLGRTVQKLPAEPFEDILTAFYNLRSGCYGAVPFAAPGRIPLLVTEKASEVALMFPPRTSRRPGHDYYAVAEVDPSISQVGTRRIRGWLSAALIPVEAVIEDASFFGNITLRLETGHDACSAEVPAGR